MARPAQARSDVVGVGEDVGVGDLTVLEEHEVARLFPSVLGRLEGLRSPSEAIALLLRGGVLGPSARGNHDGTENRSDPEAGA